MDFLHSRNSQYNARGPTRGPQPLSQHTQKTGTAPDPLGKRSSSATSKAGPSSSRPIATNSRVKKDEKYRKDMYLAFVNNALHQKTLGNTESFDELVSQFNPQRPQGDNPPASAQLRLWILALSNVVSRLEKTHAVLVEAVVSMPWTTMDNALVKSYTFFIGMLLSARPEYLSLILSKVAQGFTHQFGLQAVDAGQPESSSAPLTRRVVYDRLHYLLRHILSLIPTLPSTLQPLLVRNFPHKRLNLVAQATYIRNLLRITEYCPELADKILATIVDRAIQIDVEIQVELEEVEDNEAEVDRQTDVFELDPFDTVVGQDGEEESDDSDDDSDGEDNLSDLSSNAGEMDDPTEATDVPSNSAHIADMVRKLDAILTLIFDHFHRSNSAAITTIVPKDGLRTSSPPSLSDSIEFVQPKPVSAEEGKALRRSQFHTLLAIFDRTIIRTFKSRYTQFLVFWYSSLDPEFSDLFQGLLVSKALLEDDQPAVTRSAAASYIASFVSRAEFVDREAARRVVGVLCVFLRNKLDDYDVLVQTGGALPGMAHHSIFYAVAQAVFLIFCFRWRDLLEESEADGEEDGDVDDFVGVPKVAKKWMAELGVIQRVITSSLNPLKVCSSNVVGQFARVSQATDFIYCYSIMESNRRSEYIPNSHASSPNAALPPPPTPGGPRRTVMPVILGESINAELNTFFPFDPYKLPKSNVYIEGVYREWSSVAIDDDEDEEEEDGDSEPEEDAEDQAGDAAGNGWLSIPRPTVTKSLEDDLLGTSMGAMSISPVRGIPMSFS